MNSYKKIIIFKNDAVGDLVQSLRAINNIIHHNKQNEILIYLSERSKNFDFFFKFKNVKVKIVKYDLTFNEKLNIFFNILNNKIYSIYILTPKNFYFYLPLFFRKIKFYALCIDSVNNYKRPSLFLRKLLHKYVVNDRSMTNNRPSTMKLQKDLTNDLGFDKAFSLKNIPEFSFKNLDRPENYIYFHLKISHFKKLGWSRNELRLLFKEMLKYTDNIIFTRDIEKIESKEDFRDEFNVINFSDQKKYINNSNIYLYEEIVGSDLLHIINNSKKVIAFHGMMTNLASINKKPVLDLFFCEIKSTSDLNRYKNAIYEFKPRYKNYDLIIPSKNLEKTLRKMKFSLIKDYA